MRRRSSAAGPARLNDDLALPDALHQTLDSSRVNRDCVLKVIRGVRTPVPMYLTVRPAEVLRP